MKTADKVINIAKAEIGYLEKSKSAYIHNPAVIYYKLDGAGYDNINKYAFELDKTDWYNGPKNGFPWCAAFVDWCMVKAYGYDEAAKMKNHGIYDAVVDYAIDQYKEVGRWFDEPKPGDQIFFAKSNGVDPAHTGLVVGVDDTYVHTVEGNTDGQDGYVESNGGGVFLKKYYLRYWRILGYGRPFYEEDDYMTDKEIFEAYNRYAVSREVPKDMKAEYEEAKDMGITDGSRPMGVCTRIESTLMTFRAIKKMLKK